jgi:hypothetical protein
VSFDIYSPQDCIENKGGYCLLQFAIGIELHVQLLALQGNMARQESLGLQILKLPLSLRIGDTILLYYSAEKRTSEGAQKSGYVIANFSW